MSPFRAALQTPCLLDVLAMILHDLPGCPRRALAAAIVLGAALGLALVSPVSARTLTPPIAARAFPFNDGDCGPPSDSIPGPPPQLIVVGQPMSDSWLMC